MPEGMSKPYNGNQDFSSLAESAWDIPYQYLKGSFNNYVDKTAGGWGWGQKMYFFVHAQGMKTVHAVYIAS